MTVVWKTTAFQPGCLGIAFEEGLAMTCAGAITALALSTGSLPPGITVSAGTDPRLIGTPTVAGAYTFTLTANDGSGAVVSPSYTLTVFASLGDAEQTAFGLTPAALAAQRKLN